MEHLLNWLKSTFGTAATGVKSGILQGILHLAAVYIIARICVPWLLEHTHETILPLILGRPPRASFQFFFSHLFAFSFVPGLIAGFFNVKVLRHGIVRFVWVIPVAILAYAFVFSAPGMYPTMILDSDFKQALHFYFGGNFNFPEYDSYRELWKHTPENFEIIRGYTQFRITVPAYVGTAYSLGGWVSLRLASAGVRPASRVEDKSW